LSKDVFSASITPITRYLIIEENLDKCNGIHVADNKSRFDFLCEGSEFCSQQQICMEVTQDLLELGQRGLVILVGHSIDGDIEALRGIGLDLQDMFDKVLDIALLHQGRHHLSQKRSLSKILDESDIVYQNLHNAGNDAHYTLCGGISLLRKWGFEDLGGSLELL